MTEQLSILRPAAIEVSIPCSSCSAPVRYGSSSCPGCGVRLSRDALRALHERLAGSSAEFRELQNRRFQAFAALIGVSVLSLLLSVVYYYVVEHERTAYPNGVRVEITFSIDLLFAFAFAMCGLAARRSPLAGVMAGCALFAAMILVQVVILPQNVGIRTWASVLYGIALGIAIGASVRARYLHKKLSG